MAQTDHLNEEIQTIATEPEAKHDLTSPRFFADPHAVFRRMRAEDPVYWHPALKTWFLVRYDDVQRILRDPRFSATRPELYGREIPPNMEAKWKFVNRFLSDMLVFRDGPIHTRSRSLIGKAFTSKAVEALRPFIQQTVDDRIDAIRPHGRMDVIEQLALPLPVSVISKMLVIGLLHAANRDPARFSDADRLDITRQDNYHVGFGYGPHICVGAPIARMETRIAINTMLQRLPEIALASTSLEWSTNFVIRGVRALPVTFRS